MSRVHNSNTALEKKICEELIRNGITTFKRNDKSVLGKPDIIFPARKIAVFVTGTSGMDTIGKMLRMKLRAIVIFGFPRLKRP